MLKIICKPSCSGYSLIELIISIVLTGIVLVIFYSFFAENQKNSASPVFQVKAAQLGQAYLEEISLKKYDENSPVGNALPCNAPTAVACSATLASEAGETRTTFDDLDDYNGLSESPPRDALNNARSGFNNFSVNVVVNYAGADFGLAVQDLKRVTVTVVLPDSSQYVFSQYESNF